MTDVARMEKQTDLHSVEFYFQMFFTFCSEQEKEENLSFLFCSR